MRSMIGSSHTRAGGDEGGDPRKFGLARVETAGAPAKIELLPDQPTLHANYASKMVSVKDGLPKYVDLPAELGGSGEMLPD